MHLLNILSSEPSIVIPPNTDPLKVTQFLLGVAFVIIIILLILIIRLSIKLNKHINQNKQN